MRRSWKRRARANSDLVKKTTMEKDIEKKIQTAREQEVEKISLRKQRVKDLIRATEERISNLSEARHHIVMRKVAQRELKVLEDELSSLQGNAFLVKFDKKVAPYLRTMEIIKKTTAKEVAPPIKRRKIKKKDTASSNQRKTAAHTRDIHISESRAQEDNTMSVLFSELQYDLGEDLEDEDPVYVCTQNYCPSATCQNVLMNKIPTESILSCPQCGLSTPYLDATAAATGHSDERSFSQFAYKRQNHFDNWLKTCQGKESVTVPPEVTRGVCAELYKRRVLIDQITPPLVRDCLKTMEYNRGKNRKWYENVVLICSLLTGKPPPRFPPQVEQTLKRLFMKLQKPFESAREAIDPTRKNFLSYSYVAMKLVQLIQGSVDKRWLTAWPVLKGRDKLYKSDRLWAHMMMTLGWKFVPSI